MICRQALTWHSSRGWLDETEVSGPMTWFRTQGLVVVARKRQGVHPNGAIASAVGDES